MTAVHYRGNTRSHESKGLFKNESAVSPVIGTILMVAVTVMLSAGVYVWTTVFSDDAEAPESASIRATGIDRNADGLTGWVRLTLISGNDAPYNHEVVGLQFLQPNGTVLGNSALCAGPGWNGNACAEPVNGTWNVGESLYLPCAEAGKHIVTLNIRGHTVLDKTMTCDQAAVDDA